MTYPPSSLGARTDASLAVPGQHAADHTAEREAINTIVAELGQNPQGAHPTVQDRIAAIEARLSTWDGGTGHVPTVSDSPGYPYDFSSLSGLSGTDEIQGWTVMDLTGRGLWSRSLVLQQVERSTSVWTNAYAYNLDNPSQFVKWNRYFGTAGSDQLAHDWSLNQVGNLSCITAQGFFAVGNLSTEWLKLETNVFSAPPVKVANRYWTIGKQTNGTWGLISFDPTVIGFVRQSPFTFASGVADSVEIVASGSTIWARRSSSSSTAWNPTLNAYEVSYTYYATPINSDGSFGQTTSFSKRHVRGLMLATGDGDALIACEFGSATLGAKVEFNRLATSGALTLLFDISVPQSYDSAKGISHSGGRNIVSISQGNGSWRILVVTYKGFTEVAANVQPRGARIAVGPAVTWGLNDDATTVRYVTGSQLMEKRLGI